MVVHLDLAHADFEQVGHHREADAARVAGLGRGEYAFVRVSRAQDDDLVPVSAVEQAVELSLAAQLRFLAHRRPGVARQDAFSEHGRYRTAADEQDRARRLETGQPVIEPQRQRLGEAE